jgi:prevent-host-death family protein
MKVAPLFEVKNHLSEYVSRARRGPVVITRNGRPCAAIVGIEGEDLEAFLLRNHPLFLREIDRAHTRALRDGTVPLAEVEREVSGRERARARGRRA